MVRPFRRCNWLHLVRIPIILLLVVVQPAGMSFAADWGQFDPDSNATIDHGLWDSVLDAFLLPYTDEASGLSEWDCRTVASRIRTCDTSTGSNRNMKGINLVPYKFMEAEFALAIRGYLAQMSDIDITRYNKDEQLAYWLNVHNAAVVLNILDQYPIGDIDDLKVRPREKRPDPDKLWNKKVITVNGTRLSLHQIEQDIVFRHWDDPLVVYGFFDGAIGSPKLRANPYEGATIYKALEDNGREFVNSLRILRFRGKEARVSTVYAWARQLFDDRGEILRHIKDLARPILNERLDDVIRVRATFYDYNLAEYRPRAGSENALQQLDRFSFRRSGKSISPSN